MYSTSPSGLARTLADRYSHSIWVDDDDMLTCITDPRCIAKEHYVPPAGATDLSLNVPEEELGTIPLYHLHSITYVSPVQLCDLRHADILVWVQAEGSPSWCRRHLGHRCRRPVVIPSTRPPMGSYPFCDAIRPRAPPIRT